MSQEVKVPSVGESVSSGILAVWLKQDGDYVTQGEEIFELETDKATMAVPAPANGVLKIAVPKDTEVAIGQVVAHLEEGAAAKPAGDAANGGQPAGTTAVAAAVAEELSPAVRRLVADRGVDPASIAGTGKGGRITKEDVLAAADRAPSGAAKSTATPGPGATATGAKQPAQSAPKSPQDGEATQRRVPMTTLRRRIAENLVHSKQSAAHLTTFNEVDMSAVMEIRKKYRDQFEKKHGVRLGFMSFFIKASQRALEAFPEANAFVDGTDILYNDYYNIGVASSTERGLITPVIRDADRKSFADIEREIVSFTTRAKEKKLSPDELLGGTFTISNGGVFGSMLSTPIPNPPQSTILGMHAIQDRPMAVDGQVVIRPMMYLALTYDHRILDGREAIGFLVKIKNLIEDPAQLMLDL